jgi:hypothetical protein
VIALLAALSLPLFASAASVFDHPATAQQLLEGVLKQPAHELATEPVLRGRFTHRRYIAELPAPLVSTGEFVIVRGQGIYWHTLEPFDSEFILTQHGISQRDEGAQTLKMNADEQPAVRLIARIFLALLSMDVQSLTHSFQLYGSQSGAVWQVGLRPSVAGISSMFREAVVSGSRQVDQVTLYDTHQDRTEISFHDFDPSHAPLTAAEKRKLGM